MESKREMVAGERFKSSVLTFPLHICYQEMKEKVLSRAMKKRKNHERAVCRFASFEQSETATEISTRKSTGTMV